ncbi:MAG: hypothetical protein JWQ34_571 [Mucilaginibacter sp.]|uniref:hypothetical protein n=1 Tax=Mucilaginibacter sp. TaxID=1882438 RepID=UPI002621EF36|nr:hypothetical protein [Mucilaginibacter sp.]MDB5002346.1 hypothetical protein [Mucilaginibacter sp.]
MKPNREQQEFIKAKLNGILRYRETYAEVYDHILLALAQQADYQDFETLVNNIIEQDFGGDFKLRQMEDKCRVAAIKKVKKQYRQSFMRWFKSVPLLVSVAATFLLLNYIALQSLLVMEVFFGLIILIPEIIFIAKRIKTGYLFGDTKASLRDAILKKMTYGSVFIYVWLAILSQSIILIFSISKQQGRYVEQLIITTYTVLFIIRAETLSKLYKGDIELSLNQ